TPMLSEAAGGELDPRHIVSSVQKLPHRITFVQGRVDSIDLASKTVKLTSGADHVPQANRSLTADQLVIALGSVTNYHGIQGLADHSLGIKTVADAMHICGRAVALLDLAANESDLSKRRALLTFVVGGGGYTGVETMAALNDLVRERVRQYPSLSADDIRTILIEPGDRLLAEITPDLAAYAQSKLNAHGIEIRLKTEITGAGDGYVELKGGERIAAQTLIWAAGITPSPLAAGLDCAHNKHHAIEVDASFAVKDRPGAWALGDCAAIPHSSGKDYAPTAQNATREGMQVARNIVAVLRGAKPEPFVYTPIGELALVGKHDGVARIYGHNFSGLPAWVMWRVIYLAKMPGVGQRSRILLDWTLDFAFGRTILPVPQELKPHSR
ncbi:MAG: FAD-dependent oxidoreductase, partial [Acidobacteriota bacterium]|nr:FAD-dependent oxidoreductase [Acidobacteriota bacterium]